MYSFSYVFSSLVCSCCLSVLVLYVGRVFVLSLFRHVFVSFVLSVLFLRFWIWLVSYSVSYLFIYLCMYCVCIYLCIS